jgi:hypothetical protein
MLRPFSYYEYDDRTAVDHDHDHTASAREYLRPNAGGMRGELCGLLRNGELCSDPKHPRGF